MSLLPRVADERFLEHRRRSTSIAGVVGGCVAVAFFLYHDVVDHVWNWELLAVAISIAAVKVALMAWYTWKD